MTRVDSRTVLSIEQECQTTVAGRVGRGTVSQALTRFMRTMTTLAPTLPGGGGLFNGYGRVYVDTNDHLEFAAIECDSPYVLAQVVDTQYGLARKATEELERRGLGLLLVNNNHSGLLHPETAFWGTHENYLIHRPAPELADLALPFLATRIYGGAGGVLSPTAEFLAGARPLVMRVDKGGGTTANRAIYSTCREEHHQGPTPGRYRLHLILGDGHRSQFNLALQLGATALALRSIQLDENLPEELRAVELQRPGESWVGTLQRLNKLAVPGESPSVHPSVIEVQRIYLEAARRTVDAMADPEAWMPQILDDWHQTLSAYESADDDWLAARLDAFTKYRLFSHYLQGRGRTWTDVVGDVNALSELALLDHDYHAISQPRSVFSDLEERGLLHHRVSPEVTAGSEEEPYVPNVHTRARARARFIKEHAPRGDLDLHMSWEYVKELNSNRVQTLFDPFADCYSG